MKSRRNRPRWVKQILDITRKIKTEELNIYSPPDAVLEAYETFIGEYGHLVSEEDVYFSIQTFNNRSFLVSPASELAWWARSWWTHRVLKRFFASKLLWKLIDLISEEYRKDVRKMLGP